MNITYRELAFSEYERINEIDASLFIKRAWRKVDGVMQWVERNIQNDDYPDGYENHLAALKQTFEGGGFAYGAFDGERLIGFCSVNRDVFGKQHKYVLLDQNFISAEYRRKGIGRKLFFMCAEKAKQWGVDKFYICAASFEETLAYYYSLGCEDAKEINQELYESDEYDIQLEYDFTKIILPEGKNMKEIESNKHAWGQISEGHYRHFKKSLLDGSHKLNKYIQDELGDLSGKKIIHLQCNTGADTILLAKMGASAVGVDLVPDNILYAKKLAGDLGVTNTDFIESDIMDFMEKHNEKYDVVFVSEGAIGWLPDLKKWGQTIRHLLKDDGFFYVFDAHPFFLMFDEPKLAENIMEVKYPYFGKEPDVDDSIGGYASAWKNGVKAYFWMYTVSDIINALASAGLHIEYFNEFREYMCDMGGMKSVDGGLWNYDFNDDKFPMSFSLKARVYNK